MLSEFATGETNSKDERGGELIFFGMTRMRYTVICRKGATKKPIGSFCYSYMKIYDKLIWCAGGTFLHTYFGFCENILLFINGNNFM